MQPSDSLIPIGLGSGRPLPSAYPGARATRSNEGLLGVRAVLFQRAVVVDPAGCGALLAHGAGPAVAFRLHEALGTQEDVVSRLQGLRPLARVPTHRRLRYRGRRKAHYRRGWAGPSPGGARTR